MVGPGCNPDMEAAGGQAGFPSAQAIREEAGRVVGSSKEPHRLGRRNNNVL